ncbi:Glutaredoxin-C2 [Diplonema papillatum]|nr:Glutaredoxin-C2 [Diplonema papillatum]|eukprot:gene3113-4888_t
MASVSQAVRALAKPILGEAAAASKVLVFSKTSCPYCSQVKQVFSQLGVQPAVVELDVVQNGSRIQAELHSLTQQRTVPNVFIGEMHVGGASDTIRLYQDGELTRLIDA